VHNIVLNSCGWNHSADSLQGALHRQESSGRRVAVAHVLHWLFMSRRISQRELRNESGRIMRALDRGESFTVTRNGVPVGELVPVRPRVFVAAETVAAAYRRAPRIAHPRFRRDIDAGMNQDPTPRG
jgi:prevent-host-death family protein